MKHMPRFFAVLAFALLAVAGCDELGQFDRPGDYGSLGGDLIGEVRRVNTRDREIELRSDSGRTLRLRYDDNTRVVYRQRDYAISNLEPGDYVAVRAQEGRDGRSYADYITVQEAAQDRSGSGRGSLGRLDRLEGRVEYIDSRRGSFEVRDRGKVVVVTLPYSPPRNVSDRFNRLREGDFVRVEGRYVNDARFELNAFL
jgi:uncharacterized protein DUF5666